MKIVYCMTGSSQSWTALSRTKTAPVHSADANNSTLLVQAQATIRSQNFKAIWNVIILVSYATGLDYQPDCISLLLTLFTRHIFSAGGTLLNFTEGQVYLS